MNDVAAIILGALLAIVGGAISEIISSWINEKRERGAMKVSFIDELSEIEETINKMHETWTRSQIFHPAYIGDIQSNTQTYDALRQRLFLFDDKVLRKEIVSFYKRLKDTAKQSEGKLGTLSSDDSAKAEQAGFEAEFSKLGEEAKKIRTKLGD